MHDDSDQVLTHAHHINLDDICSNLHGAQIYTTTYFKSGALHWASIDELVQAVSKAHAYLDVHMDMLALFKLIDSFYGLALHSQIYGVTHQIPAMQCYDFHETLCILGDSGYTPDDDSSVGEADLHPFCLAVMPPPIKPVATPSPSKLGDVAGPSTSSQKVPKPKMIRTPQAPKEPTFASPTKKQVSVVLPPKSANSVPAPKTKKVSPAKPAAPKRVVQTRAAVNKKAPMPVKNKLAVKKPVVDAKLSLKMRKAKGKEKAVALVSPTSPSLHSHAVHNKRSLPHSSKDCHKANKSPITSGSKVMAAATPAALLEADHVNNTIYVQAFHPQVDLQFHELPSCQALESMKLSMLPSMPNSLTKVPTQVCNGREYVYQCHSDLDPHFIHPLLLTWPCYNCTLSGYPEECKLEGEVSEEVCTKCKTGRHGPCSACWDTNQLCCATTLLDLLTLSSDRAIHHGVDRVEHINAEIALLSRAMHCLHEDHNKIVGELADGLDAIFSHEHGTEIIDAYAQVSDFLKSFVVHLGEAGGDSDAEGEASKSGAS
ncbi:hypothetical protein EDD85DRAFT_976062 [Armillaria nabsnona]|nr:hypothetical protein EDD85DRAFT_976062 [Armillaria nabsnona]